MKKAIKKISISTIVLLCCVFFSCNKPSGAATTAQEIVGKWKLIDYAFDNSNTGIIEQNEIQTQPADQLQEMTFKQDDSGVLTSGPTTNTSNESFFYVMEPNDYVSVDFSAHDTIVYYILAINSSTLILTTRSNSPVLLWYKYEHE